MTDLTSYLIQESEFRQSIMPQDVVKLCFQAAFGAEHALEDLTQAQTYFLDEYKATPQDEKPLAEYIAPTVCRVNLSAWKRLKLNPDWLWNLFASAVPSGIKKNNKDFINYIIQADKLSRIGKFHFTYVQWQAYLNDYKNMAVASINDNRVNLDFDKTTEYDFSPVRHSAVYRDKEKPAYRVLSGIAAKAVLIIEAMAGLENGIIAIDGRAASGKSTMAAYLCDIISAKIIAMDDFFLPSQLRTTERLATPGGNIHHERFIQEVLPYLKNNKEFLYRRFDCNKMDFDSEPVRVPPSYWHIIEGVYSFHPELGKYMDIRVFLDIKQVEQESRINTRNNTKVAADYFSKWIPMEEKYLKEYDIRESADVIIDANILRR